MTIIIAIILLLLITLFIRWNNYSESMVDNYLNGIDIIYWINLDRSPDRKNYMEKMFQDKVFDAIPNKRIAAIDGKNSDNIHSILEIEHKTSTDYEYACLLSHLESIRTFNNSNYDIALIMEDDATLEFKKYWKKTIKEIINNAPSDWEIITLCYIINDAHPYHDWNKINNDYSDIMASSALSYLINKKGSSKIINATYNNRYRLNQNTPHRSDFYIYDYLKTYVYKYPMFIYKTDNDSTIHEDHLDLHKKNKERIVLQYKTII